MRSVKWSVGILTCQREQPTVRKCLEATISAGWERMQIIPDLERSGCYRGWLKMAGAILEDSPSADLLLLIEDDCILPAGLRHFLDDNLPFSHPHVNQCWNSLYCSAGLHSDSDVGWREVATPRQCWGSVAYVIAPPILRKLLDDPPYPSWRDGTDRAVGQFCRVNRIPYVIHSPSLANHIGECSSLDQPGGVDENRRCKRWVKSIRRNEYGFWTWTVAGGDGGATAEMDVEVRR